MPKPKQISMDAAFKSLLRDLDIPKQKDIEKLNAKIDRLGKLIKTMATQKPKSRTKATTPAKKSTGTKRANSATAVILAKIHPSKRGLDIEALKKKTGFEDKKVRNIVARLYKLGKIKRVSRGTYVGS